jgi:hypothetical protein
LHCSIAQAWTKASRETGGARNEVRSGVFIDGGQGEWATHGRNGDADKVTDMSRKKRRSRNCPAGRNPDEWGDGAVERNRTFTGCPTATSTLRVYQFRHYRTILKSGADSTASKML